MVRVLVVEDSPVARELLVHILTSDPAIEVMGTAGNGAEAVAFLKRQRPDVITMDINMPRMDGFEATRRIMEVSPVPIIVVSASLDTREVATTFRAMEAGAVAALPLPYGIGHPEHEATARQLTQTVKLMAEVKVVKRWLSRPARSRSGVSPPEAVVAGAPTEIRIVAIGASTGGPPVLKTILSGLPETFPAPLLITQHIAAGFVQGFVGWLAQACAFPVRVATPNEAVLPGHAYVAPDDLQMGITPSGRITLTDDPPEHGLRPSVSYLFRSVAAAYGQEAVGVLLSGMGRDGALELRAMREKGAVTIAQDKASSVVHGMPGAAIELDAVDYVLPPDGIISSLKTLVTRRGA